MAEKFSLNDHLFNADTVMQLAAEYAAGVPGFKPQTFVKKALSGFKDRALKERLEWMADCLEPQLAQDFPSMADQIEAALPAPLDPSLRDDDFGHFIHAVHGVLIARHGLEETYRDRALDALHAATQRFSMEYYIRPFLNRWPEETLARLRLWAKDENYHVRRLVSEGTRPRLPWATAVDLTTAQRMPLLNALHADPTRFVTRSVANHLNDIAKSEPEQVCRLLSDWTVMRRQNAKELAWMKRHALRTLIKDGYKDALELLGYRTDAPVFSAISIHKPVLKIGEPLKFAVLLKAWEDLPVIVDYRLTFARPDGKQAEKVFKLKTTKVSPDVPLTLDKVHKLKADATTFKLHPGPHKITVQINGQEGNSAEFELV